MAAQIREAKLLELAALVKHARAQLSHCIDVHQSISKANDVENGVINSFHASPLHSLIGRITSLITLLSTFDDDGGSRLFLDWAAKLLNRIMHDAPEDDRSNEAAIHATTDLVTSEPITKGNGCTIVKDNVDVDCANPSEQSFHPQQPQDILVSWDHIIGAKSAVTALKQAVVLPRRMPQLFSGARKPWGCILLYGPPGTGKTLLASASAKEAGTPFISVSVSDLLSKWVGDTEKSIRDLFRAASQCERCIIFLDEVDALCGARGSNSESEGSRRAKTEILIRMQNVDPRKVTIIAATNLPWDLDTAFRRRFDRVIYVGLPDAQERDQVLRHYLVGAPHSIGNEELTAIAHSNLEGFSPCDISHVCQHAMMIPIERLQAARHFRLNTFPSVKSCDSAVDETLLEPCASSDDGAFPAFLEDLDPRLIAPLAFTNDDLIDAARSHPMTISREYLQQYDKWEASLRVR
ncbi:vacuolar transport protein 4A, putative [Bodo saltans]|uniref:Vacuolar transport protein 4A, putative n=1 Tax=Bodo saltans TaxID=75058 RepID=A0A0S4IM94_BODSA|nr:vacuolar transport protein 4A, putative [Bodo saltans]|eukprot:CUE71629.1 vacuolar transport protein 4A, putative [Bodo saltans]